MSIKNRHIFTLALALLLLAGGCRSHKEAARNTPADSNRHTPPTVVTPETPAYTPHYRTANFTCTAMGYSANGQLRMLEDSVIWFSATKIIELGRAKATPDSVIAYVKIAGRYFAGTYDDLFNRFHYRTSFAELQAILNAQDAEKQIAALAKKFNITATVKLQPWKDVATTTFPMNIPSFAKKI